MLDTYIVPTELHYSGGCFIFYRYLAPNGAVPQGQDVDRKQIKISKKSRRDDIFLLPDINEIFYKISKK